jgi:hypothetical protein
MTEPRDLRAGAELAVQHLTGGDLAEARRGLSAAVTISIAEVHEYSTPDEWKPLVFLAVRIINAAREHQRKRASAPRPMLEIRRNGKGDTNVVELRLPYQYNPEFGRVHVGLGPAYAAVLTDYDITCRISHDRRASWRRMTRAPIANDLGEADRAWLKSYGLVDDAGVVWSRPMGVRMAMKGRLARIMAESNRAPANA